MEPLIKQNGAANATVDVSGQVGRPLGSRCRRRRAATIKGPCSRIDLMKQHAGIDVQAMYPAGAPPKADGWTFDAFLKAAEACHKAGFPFGIGLGTTTDSVDSAGAIFDGVRRRAGRRQGQHHRQVRPGAPGARLLRPARSLLPAGRARMGRRLQQQMPGLRQGLADPEPAERLGGGQARRAADRRAAVDARHAGRTEGPLRAVASRISGASGTFGKNKSAAKSLLMHLSQPERHREDGGREPAASTCRRSPT